MSKDEKILIKIFEGVVSKKKKVKVTLESNLRDELGIDSIKLLNIILEIEKNFKIDMIQLTGSVDFTNVETVADVMKIIEDIKSK